MKGSSGFDTYRILIPGGVILVLIDVAARLLGSLEPAAGPWELIPVYADEVRRTVEDPLAALVVAFALGLLLYWLDPAYAAPEYQRYLPSEYLGRRLEENRVDSSVAVSVYMHALNELMSDSLNERIILMGSMYRIGFDTVFATFVVGSLMAVGSALALGGASVDLSMQPFSVDHLWLFGAAIMTGVLAWRTRPKPKLGHDHKNDSTNASGIWIDVARSSLIVAVAVVGILLYANVGSSFWSSISLIVAYSVIISSWAVLRLRGPQWRRWWRTIRTRGTRTFVPKKQFELWQVALIDGALVVSASLLLAAIGNRMKPIQIAVPNVLLLTAFILAYLRKYERQLHAVYWNQHTWIDLNMNRLLQLASSLEEVSKRDASSSNGDRTDTAEKE